MSQTRLYFQASRAQASRAYELLDRAFEEDGLPLAIIEIDEAGDLHEVSVYADADVDSVRERMSDCLGSIAGLPAIQEERVPEIDWVSHVLQGLHAVRAGRFFVHGSHERSHARPGEIAIEIDAGLAFGTGHHGTTAGCLEMIGSVVDHEKPRNALDLGTGSAVLAIGIAKLAHIPVLATDIDAVATRVAQANIRRNEVAGRVRAITATGFQNPEIARHRPFDLIVANILARPLMRLAPAMARHLSSQGSVILSGILESQRNMVVAAYVGQRFRHVRTLRREGWVTILLKR